MMYHISIICRSEFGVARSQFGRCSQLAGLVIISTRALRRARVRLPTAANLFSRPLSVAAGHPWEGHRVVALVDVVAVTLL